MIMVTRLLVGADEICRLTSRADHSCFIHTVNTSIAQHLLNTRLLETSDGGSVA